MVNIIVRAETNTIFSEIGLKEMIIFFLNAVVYYIELEISLIGVVLINLIDKVEEKILLVGHKRQNKKIILITVVSIVVRERNRYNIISSLNFLDLLSLEVKKGLSVFLDYLRSSFRLPNFY